MTVFLLITKEEAKLAPLLEKHGPENVHRLDTGQWLVRVKGSPTAKTFWSDLDQGTEATPVGFAIAVGDYYGFAARYVWDFMATGLKSDQ